MPITTRPGSVPGGPGWSGRTDPPKPKRKKKYPAPKGYVGGWKLDPGLSKKRYKTVKTGKGYYIAKPLKGPKGSISIQGSKPKAPGAAAPAAPPAPYSEYATTAPWAIPLLTDLDRREASHTAYVTGQVMPWLSGGLRALTGVDPAAPGYNPLIQQQYQANIQGQVGGALNAAAAAVPGSFAPTTPGASTAAPNAYLGRAMQEASAQRAGAAINMAQAQSVLNTVAPNIYAQSALRSMADYAAGLPAVYVTKRNELRSKIDQFVEDVRHNKVTEATNAMVAQGNLAISLGSLGVRAQSEANDAAAKQAEAKAAEDKARAEGRKPTAAEIPVGFVAVPDGSGGWNVVRDPTVPQASASGGDGSGAAAPSPAKGQYPPNKLRKEGYVGGWTKKPKAKPPKGQSYVQATDGTWWLKGKGTGSGSTPKEPKSPFDLTNDLRDFYKPGDTGGVEERRAGNPAAAAKEVAAWVRKYKSSFVGPGRVVKDKVLRDVIIDVIGGGAPGTVAWRVLDILTRGYMVKRGGKYYWK